MGRFVYFRAQGPSLSDCAPQNQCSLSVIVTIDGPAGSGKSTTARRVASRLGFVYLDTGAMYRAVALAFVQQEVAVTASAAREVLPTVEVDVQYRQGTMHVFLDGDNVTDHLRDVEVDEVVSQISTLEPVRTYMVREQRRIGHEQEALHGGVVLDGRDTGTVVFPDANLKIYMVADLDERARRRLRQYEAAGEDVSFEAIRDEIEARDRRDRNRDIAPLRRAEDAVTLDTTDRTVEEQVSFVVDRVKERQSRGT